MLNGQINLFTHSASGKPKRQFPSARNSTTINNCKGLHCAFLQMQPCKARLLEGDPAEQQESPQKRFKLIMNIALVVV